ncbi:hypothetical protein [Ectothiorhodospira shaposhnikovii]|uniref:hypothetical protein n=1 Tax=Ectothiorhodospira shaposhnikovii TaxID=1054 RepID=UPI0039A1D6E8
MKALYKFSHQAVGAAAFSMVLISGFFSQTASSTQSDSVSNHGMSSHADPPHQFRISWDLKPEPLSEEALDYLFSPQDPDENQLTPLNLSYLNDQEMRDVTGRWGLPGAVIGGLSGGAFYLGQAMGSGEGSYGGLATAVGGGALTGALLGPVGNFGTNLILGTQVGFYSGLAIGYTQSGCASCHSARVITHDSDDM